MTKLFKNIGVNLSRVYTVFGGRHLNTLKDTNVLIDLNVESILLDIPSFEQDKRNLMGDRNIISKEYIRTVQSKNLQEGQNELPF